MNAEGLGGSATPSAGKGVLETRTHSRSVTTHLFEGSLVVRSMEREGGVWFVAADVCAALGIQNARDAVARLDEDEKGVGLTDTLGGAQKVTIINESGLYTIILRSREAVTPGTPQHRFRKWITSEVLPAIRRTGGYRLPGNFVEALRELAATEEARLALAAENAEMRPKAEFHDAVTATADLCELAVAAQVLGLPYGRNRLFQRLREMGVLITGTSRHNLPKQAYVERGYFSVKESVYKRDGETHVHFTTLVTQKGLEWLRRKLASPAHN